MPETAFSLRRIREHLRKWLGLYMAATVALCFFNHLVYTVTRPGFSDDERLKIMLLNVETRLSDEDMAALEPALLAEIQKYDAGILALEFEHLPGARPEDPAEMMLLSTKLTGGFGDIYLSDRAGFEALGKRAALYDPGSVVPGGCAIAEYIHPESGEPAAGGLVMENSLFADGEIYISVMANGTDIESALAALPALIEGIKE